MKSPEVLDAYAEQGARFLVDRQRALGMEFALGRREGPWLWNVEGTRKLLDCGTTGGVYSLGHRNPAVLETLLDAYGRLDAGIWTMPDAEALSFQSAFAATAPGEICRTILTLSSTNSIDLALMFAFRLTGRKKVVAYRHGYHGSGGFAALVTGSDTEGWFDHYRLPRDLARFFPDYGSIDEVEPLLSEDCAAVILEPMNYETFEPADPAFLADLSVLCRKRGILLIIDETRTGLGRSGSLWMSSRYDIAPDILITGKGLGAGLYPVSALATTRTIFDACMNAGHWGYMSSMACSPIAAIVARKVLSLSQAPALAANVAAIETRLRDGFGRLCADHPDIFAPAWVTGGIAALRLKRTDLADRIVPALFERGIFAHSVSEIAPTVIKFFPCLTCDPALMDGAVLALDDWARNSA